MTIFVFLFTVAISVLALAFLFRISYLFGQTHMYTRFFLKLDECLKENDLGLINDIYIDDFWDFYPRAKHIFKRKV